MSLQAVEDGPNLRSNSRCFIGAGRVFRLHGSGESGGERVARRYFILHGRAGIGQQRMECDRTTI